MLDKNSPFDPQKWYAETIWGNRIDNDDALFEIMSLQIFQAGLSWNMVVKKMHGFRKAFSNWDINSTNHAS